jgi:hypothetical protein
MEESLVRVDQLYKLATRNQQMAILQPLQLSMPLVVAVVVKATLDTKREVVAAAADLDMTVQMQRQVRARVLELLVKEITERHPHIQAMAAALVVVERVLPDRTQL